MSSEFTFRNKISNIIALTAIFLVLANLLIIKSLYFGIFSSIFSALALTQKISSWNVTSKIFYKDIKHNKEDSIANYSSGIQHLKRLSNIIIFISIVGGYFFVQGIILVNNELYGNGNFESLSLLSLATSLVGFIFLFSAILLIHNYNKKIANLSYFSLSTSNDLVNILSNLFIFSIIIGVGGGNFIAIILVAFLFFDLIKKLNTRRTKISKGAISSIFSSYETQQRDFWLNVIKSSETQKLVALRGIFYISMIFFAIDFPFFDYSKATQITFFGLLALIIILTVIGIKYYFSLEERFKMRFPIFPLFLLLIMFFIFVWHNPSSFPAPIKLMDTYYTADGTKALLDSGYYFFGINNNYALFPRVLLILMFGLMFAMTVILKKETDNTSNVMSYPDFRKSETRSVVFYPFVFGVLSLLTTYWGEFGTAGAKNIALENLIFYMLIPFVIIIYFYLIFNIYNQSKYLSPSLREGKINVCKYLSEVKCDKEKKSLNTYHLILTSLIILLFFIPQVHFSLAEKPKLYISTPKMELSNDKLYHPSFYAESWIKATITLFSDDIVVCNLTKDNMEISNKIIANKNSATIIENYNLSKGEYTLNLRIKEDKNGDGKAILMVKIWRNSIDEYFFYPTVWLTIIFVIYLIPPSSILSLIGKLNAKKGRKSNN